MGEGDEEGGNGEVDGGEGEGPKRKKVKVGK